MGAKVLVFFRNVLILLLAIKAAVGYAVESIKITVETDIYFYANQLIGNRSVHDVKDFHGINSQRDVVEFIIIQQALKLGGFKHELEFELGNYDGRNIKLLNSGLLLLSLDSIWLSATEPYKENLHISQPVIPKGRYEAGIFTSKENGAKFADLSNLDFSQLSVVSSKDWYVDWITLEAMTPRKLIHESDWIAMAKIVSRGWADVMIAPFKKAKPYVYKGMDYYIEAIPNVKVALQDSRHFVVSKKHPLGKETFEALEKGLEILQSQGVIERAYREAGFYNDNVSDWKVINQKN